MMRYVLLAIAMYGCKRQPTAMVDHRAEAQPTAKQEIAAVDTTFDAVPAKVEILTLRSVLRDGEPIGRPRDWIIARYDRPPHVRSVITDAADPSDVELKISPSEGPRPPCDSTERQIKIGERNGCYIYDPSDAVAAAWIEWSEGAHRYSISIRRSSVSAYNDKRENKKLAERIATAIGTDMAAWANSVENGTTDAGTLAANRREVLAIHEKTARSWHR